MIGEGRERRANRRSKDRSADGVAHVYRPACTDSVMIAVRWMVTLGQNNGYSFPLTDAGGPTASRQTPAGGPLALGRIVVAKCRAICTSTRRSEYLLRYDPSTTCRQPFPFARGRVAGKRGSRPNRGKGRPCRSRYWVPTEPDFAASTSHASAVLLLSRLESTAGATAGGTLSAHGN